MKNFIQKLDGLVRAKVFGSRSQAIQIAVGGKIARIDRGRLVAECAKLDPSDEIRMAEEGIAADKDQWPEY